MIRTQTEELHGFFVSDIFAWEYEDSVRYDEKHRTDYSKNWLAAAKEQGYVYIVQISGFGKPAK